MATEVAPGLGNRPEVSPALAAFEAELASQHIEGHWQEAVYLPEEPFVRIKPHLWKWELIRRQLLRAGELVPVRGADARRNGDDSLPIVTVACHEDLTASDVVGRYLLEGESTRWIDGPLTRAVKVGAICYLDEVVEARKDTTVLIHPLTDHRRLLPMEKRGQVIEAADGFLLVISYNPGYQSALKDLKHSTRQRFVALEFDYPPRELTAPYSRGLAVAPKQVVTASVRRLKTWNGWVDCRGQVLVQINQPNPRLRRGQVVRVIGRLERPGPATNPGQFDWAGYYREQRILASIRVDSADAITILDQQAAGPIAWLRAAGACAAWTPVAAPDSAARCSSPGPASWPVSICRAACWTWRRPRASTPTSTRPS